MLMALDIDDAARKLRGAAAALHAHGAKGKLGVVGFCMGGALALWLATLRPDLVDAVAPYYDVAGWPSPPDFSLLDAPVQGHYAENDDFAGPPAVQALEEELTALGKPHEFFVHRAPNTCSPITTGPSPRRRRHRGRLGPHDRLLPRIRDAGAAQPGPIAFSIEGGGVLAAGQQRRPFHVDRCSRSRSSRSSQGPRGMAAIAGRRRTRR